MIVHTLIYRFAPAVDQDDIHAFFAGLAKLATESGLPLSFDWRPHILLPVDAHARGMTATHMAQLTFADGQVLKEYSELPGVHEFIDKWRNTVQYEAAYANHEQIAPPNTERRNTMQHVEHTVTVEANADVVWEVLADVLGYPNLFPPTESVTMLEESDTHQIARFVVDVNGQNQSWVSRRDLDPQHRTIAYRQLERAPIVEHMGGEWRALPIDENRTQLVLTHDFAARPAPVAPTLEQATALLEAAVERNSVADLAAVRDESERRAHVTNRAEGLASVSG